MDRRCAAGALVALAACIATTAAAPTASNQTALDLYDGTKEGCYYNFQHYGEGDRIMTNEPCLNCTCHNRMLMCYLRVCPFTKPIGQDCSVEKRADQCCPIVTCPDVPVDLLTSTSTSSPSEYGETGIGKLDRYGCSINGKYFPEGSKVPPSPNKPCEHCYCIRNMTTCVMQECTLHVDGCTPIYRKDVCCPVRYSCDHPEDEIPLLDDMTTTVRPTPGFLLTTTTLSPVTQMTQDCVHDDKVFADGALIKTEKACEHCYCMKGDIVCVVQECGTPMENEGKNCTSMPPREGQCCPDTYICEGDELTTETKPEIATVTSFEDITTLSPPRRVSIEGSGYRSETDEPSTEVPIFEPDSEGSGEDQAPIKPTDTNDMLIPESETSPPFKATSQDDIADKYYPSTTEVLETDKEMAERATTEADKGENTVPSGDIDADTSEGSAQDKTSQEPEITTSKLEAATESSVDAKTTALPEDETSVRDKTTSHEEITATEPASIAESTIVDHELSTSPGSRTTSVVEHGETTLPTRRKDDEDEVPIEITTMRQLEETTTKASDLIAPDTVVTENTTSSFLEHETTSASMLSEKDNEVTEPTTEVKLELTTKSEVINTDNQSATTVQPEITTELSTPGKVEFTGTTPANPIENEIDEDSFPTLAPGRIPGEGDCLLDGVTYSHESIVPSRSNCHTSCRCISSIVKCEPIICSPPPDYMDNCQPMYDSPESCCPTYVCDHPKETVPPQSHSQMAGTESPIPTPTIECDGDQCEVVKDKEYAKPPVSCTSEGCTDDSSNKDVDNTDCGPQGCGEIQTKPEDPLLLGPVEGCAGDSCSSPPVHCASGNCETSIPKDQTCNNENGCEIPAIQKCEGDNCAIQPDVTATKDDSTPCADPESCKEVQISDKPSECKGDSCIPASPPQTIPQEKQDCKDLENCAQQTPAVEECNEEDCKRKQVPEINKPLSSDCTGTECIQQPDNLPQITAVPEINTESASKVTGLPEEVGTKLQEPVTDLPIIAETEPSATTKASISDKEEELGTTPQYDESVINKEKEPEPNVPESPEIVTPEGQQQESFTESVIDEETTMVPLQDITNVKEIMPEVTIGLSEAPTTEISSLPDKYSKEITTELPSFVETKTPESMTNTDNAHTETSIAEDDAKDKDILDIATTEPSVPAIYSTSSDKNMETTESQEILTMAPESLDKDGHDDTTKEPEYVQDTESKVTEPTERYTSAPDQITNNVEVETTDGQEPQDAPTTPKSYESQTNMPGALETEEPTEEVLHSSTSVPETQTTSPQEDKKESEIPVFTLTSEEPITDKPDKTMDTADDMSSPDNKAETKSPVDFDEATAKPEMVFDGSETQSPDLNITPGEESITKAPGYETEIQTESSKPLVTLPQETATEKSDTADKDVETPAPVTVNVQTETPMSIVKDHGDDEISSTITPESEITTVRDSTPCADPESCKDVQISDKPSECKGDSCIPASFTKEPESPETEQSTESIAKPTESPSEKPVSEFEKMPSVSDVEHAAATTEKSGADLETTISAVMEEVLPTKQPVHDSEITAIPETEASTDSTSVSVPITIETISSEPSVTEASIHESSVPQEETSESAPITSMPGEDIETKLPVPVTESSVQPISEGAEIITPAQEQSNENTDATELPELVIHEHPTEPSSIINESGQLATEDTATNQPDMAVKEQDITPVKDTSDAPASLDNLTVAPVTPTSEIEKEVTVISEQESVTKMPEFSQSETTESKPDDLYHIPELSPTESQKEATEGPDSQTITTNAPEIAVTDEQKVSTEAPAIQTTVTSGTKISETEPQEIVTEGQEVQNTVTDADVLVTQPHSHTTDIPVSYDMITNAPDMDPEPVKESTDKPKESDMEPHKETTGIHDITTTIPEMSPTEVHKEPTETPDLHDTATKVSDISPAESDKEGIEEPELQNVVTSVPKISTTEPQEETTTVREAEDMAPIIPEPSETEPVEPEKDVTESSVAQDLTTSIPAIIVTENVPLADTIRPMVQNKATTVPDIYETESQKEGTETPTHDDTSTNVPDGLATESQKEGTETPTHDDSSTNVPDGHATESQKDVTDSSAAQDTVTNVPDTLITESQKDTQSPEPEDAATSAPELPETEPKKETTETPAQEAGSTIPEISETEPKKEIIEMPEIQVVTDAPEMSDDSKAPTTTASESPEEVTKVSEAQGAVTNAPELQTESQKEVTDIPETSEKTATEPHDVPTEQTQSQNTVGDLSEVLTTESQKEATEIPDTSMMTSSNAPETLPTKSDKDVTDAPEQVTGEVTKTPELVQTEATGNEGETEKPAVTEKDEIFTETPLKVTKFDDHTQSEPQEFITSTEPSDSSRLTESGLPVEQVTETLVTESPDKATGSDSDIDKPSTGMPADENKPQEGQEIDTETPVVEPAKTESPISPESIKPETKAPELMDSETGTTIAPESSVTENQDHTYAPESEPQGSRRTEATSAPIEEDDVVTKAPQTLEPQDKTTKISEEPEQTSEPKEEYPETTPYLVLLEEHTHKTVSPDEDITSSPSDVPLKEDEPSTPEVTVDKVTEPAPSTETEKSPDDVISDKDQSIPELTQTTISEKITESSLVSEEISTISPSPELTGTEKPQYVESNEISTSAPMADQEPSETEKPSIPSVEAETEKEVIVSSQKPPETTAPEEEFIYATTKATTIKEEPTPISPLDDKFGKPDDEPKPAESEKQKPDTSEEVQKPGANVVPTEEAIQPGEESHFPASGTSGYGQEPDYGEEDTFGPGTCRYGGKVYVSAQQIPRDDPCDFCFCFRSDIICLQQSCPPPIHGCHEEPIQGFCCPRYECPVSMATTLNVTTTTTTTTTTLPPHFLPHAYKGAAQRRGCQIKGHTYKVGEVVRASSGPCLHCTCGGDGQMKCDPKVCTPEPMLRQMIAAAVSAKRRR